MSKSNQSAFQSGKKAVEKGVTFAKGAFKGSTVKPVGKRGKK